MKRFFDLFLSLFGIIFSFPIILIACLLIWIEDFHSPLYISERVGKNNKSFKFIKLRSMKINADKAGIDSTSSSDVRITRIGKLIRKMKLDELPQLWNVFIGDMSFVGPRPNIRREVALYTKEEYKLLTIRPGITDFSSIVFSDEGKILQDYDDPDLAYHQLIRPGKNSLALFYLKINNIKIDLYLIIITLLAIINKKRAFKALVNI